MPVADATAFAQHGTTNRPPRSAPAIVGLDAGNTGILPGPLPDGMPKLVQTFFPELSFRRPHDAHAGLLAVGPAVFAQALGKGIPVIEADIRSGESGIWLEGRTHVLGLTGTHLITYKDPTGTSHGIIEAQELAGSGLWSVGGDLQSRVVIVDDLMVTAVGDRLIARSSTNGESIWSTDIPHMSVRFLAADEKVIVGQDWTPGTLLQAWSLDDGSPLWDLTGEGADAFFSEPVIHDGRVLVATPSDLLSIDPLLGTIDGRIAFGEPLPNPVEVRISGDSVLIRDGATVQAFDLASGERRWGYDPLRRVGFGMRSAGSLVFVLVESSDALGSSSILQALNADIGDPVFEIPSRHDRDDTFSVADYIVTDGAIVLAGDAGLRVYRGNGEPYAGITSPVRGNRYTSETHGFRYTWEEGWSVSGTSFMTPDGIQLFHAGTGAAVAQYVADRDVSMDEELVGISVSYPVLFGPDTRFLLDMEQLTAPDISAHVPMPHEAMLGRFETTFNPPFDVTLCLTIAMRLEGDDRLFFEFMTAETRFDQDSPLFWSFFENLEIG